MNLTDWFKVGVIAIAIVLVLTFLFFLIDLIIGTVKSAIHKKTVKNHIYLYRTGGGNIAIDCLANGKMKWTSFSGHDDPYPSLGIDFSLIDKRN